MDAETLHDRKIYALAIGCCTIFVALFIINYLDYLDKMQDNNFIEWEVKTITSGDYTVSVEIDPDFYPDYKENE